MESSTVTSTTGNTNEPKEDIKEEVGKGDVKEEPEEPVVEIRDTTISSHNSPLEDVKSSPAQPTEKEVSSLLQTSVPCKPLQSENVENNDSSFRSETCEPVHPIGLPPEPINEGVQPLPSNVINKQPVTMEAQYMQQQSQIFVFSTALANKAAESVIQGQYTSIISYHCAQPRTKKYLEGNNQPGSVGSQQCSNNMTPEQNQPQSKPQPNNHQEMLPSHNAPLLPDSMMSSLPDFNQEMGLSPHQTLLTGVKVPDENLTPQQRQHREEQLATLRKMHQILFRESHTGPEDGSGHMEDVMINEGNVDINKPPVTQSDWHKMQMQFYEDQKLRKNRTAGPPPTYQQATRSASVPIALPSPNPSSPNNTTSNMSLPSPRTCSGVNSPADKVSQRIPGPSPNPMDSPNPPRSTNSNPPTPISIHLSPKHKDKLNTTNEFSPSSTVSAPNSQQSPVDSMYCRSMQSMGQPKPCSATAKEPNLMPVPSPQQIQYLNAFEGQELTIQKQPNTSLKETSHKSPSASSTTLEGIIPATSGEITPKVNSPPPSTPEMPNRGFPNDVPVDSTTDKPNVQAPRKMDSGFCNSPQTSERCHLNVPNNFMPKGPGFIDNSSNKCGPNNEKDMNNPNYACLSNENVPLSSAGMNRMNVSTATKSSHFDPISSLAQMSQQLTNNVPNSPVNQPPMMPNVHQNMPFNSPNSNNAHMMPMNEMHPMNNTPPDHRMQNQMSPHFNPMRPQCTSNITPNLSVSPKLMQSFGAPQRPMPRGMNYNGASIQVKPNAPNTIQYLPSRPQTVGPRGPPSLEFLQRFSNPLSNLDAKVPTHNLQYFPNNYPQNNMNEMGICPPHGNVRGPVRGPNPNMMRLQSPQMPPMNFNNTDVYPNSNCQIFGPPSKPSTMGLAPDASQPLPPSMGQPSNFKNATFIGPTTADPNYAQQFHNFQQQLYATNTRGQLNNQNMGTNQHYFIPK